jgi:hypothetical protein
VNLICAATFLGAIGDPSRFFTSRKLVAYLGLDPKVRQSGEAPARSGRISKRGSASARWALVEAAWSVVKQPGPLRAFYERVRARRGHGKAIVATARKLAQPRDPRRRTRAHTPGRGVLQADGHRPAGRAAGEKSGRERDTGARINQALKGAKLRGRLKAPDVCTSLRQSPAPTRQPNP